MVLTSFPTDQRRGKVRVKITAHTVCKPHGHVFAGDEHEVEYSEYLLLKENGKAELVKAALVKQQPATLEELEQEVLSRGYSEEAAKKIAQRRFDGQEGDSDAAREAARYLAPQQPVSEQLGGDPAEGGEAVVTESVLRVALEGKKKADIVALAKQEFGLDLNEADKKEDLIDAVLKAALGSK